MAKANIKTFSVTCIRDKRKNRFVTKIKVDVDNNLVRWGEEHTAIQDKHQIISARFRYDGQWGFECACGNKDIQSEQEKRIIADPRVPAKPQELHEIIKNTRPEKPKFALGVN